MRHASLTVIQDEHQALAAMLRSLSMLVTQSHQQGKAPPFNVLRAMLFYVDEFPERLHHPKESQLLFPKLRSRCPELGPVFDRLDADHARGEKAIRDLEHALLAYEVMGESRREAFEQATQRYIDAYLSHMSVEESEILPAARKHLSEDDWAELDAAFATNRDPLAGHSADETYRPLFQMILSHAPAPVGLG
ncbi:MAG: hemerythrin domain-containing protein [Burkholderiales bacterium]|nr:hemerythrin domain-containing protein [Burkholderiales bacterium]